MGMRKAGEGAGGYKPLIVICQASLYNITFLLAY